MHEKTLGSSKFLSVMLLKSLDVTSHAWDSYHAIGSQRYMVQKYSKLEKQAYSAKQSWT